MMRKVKKIQKGNLKICPWPNDPRGSNALGLSPHMTYTATQLLPSRKGGRK